MLPAQIPNVPAISLASSPIATLGGGAAPMGFAPTPAAATTSPAALPPGGAEDAMGGPEGAIVGEALKVDAPSELASMVRGHFDLARMARQEQEAVWERCHDNYRGTAPKPVADQAMRLKSNVTMKITRTKVAASVARLKEIGFKYGIKPTPEPAISDMPRPKLESRLKEILGSMQNQDLAQKIEGEFKVDELYQQVRDIANSRSERMRTRIDDDFVEMRWDAMYDQGLLDDSLYGTMIFKGPLTKERRPGRWVRKEGVWGFLDVDPDQKLYRPEMENISPWDFYPSPGAWMVEKLDWAIVRNVMGQREVADLSDNPGFDSEAVFKCLADKTGAWTPEPWEAKLFAANKQATAVGMGLPDKFVVYDWWGYIKVADLKRMGGKIDDVKVWDKKKKAWVDQAPNENEVVIANVWVCGNHVLKAWSTNLKPRRLPFYVIPYERIPKCIWGQGVAWMMEDWQAVMNTVYRAMMDNMAISALPIGWFDRSRLRGDDKGELFPGKMYEMKDTERMTIPPVQFFFPPNNVAHMRMIAEIARANVQESTSLPDLVSGYQTGATHNRTAAGMSMLGGWADTSTRSVQKNIDQEGTRQIVRAIYFWEMQFSNDDSIKGDFDVEALGVESVMADEVLSQRMIQWGEMMQRNPATAQEVDWKKFGNRSAQKMGLKEEGLMLSRSEILARQKESAGIQMEMEAEKARRGKPQMDKTELLMKALEQTVEGSSTSLSLLRQTLETAGLLSQEVSTAITNELKIRGHLDGGQLSETDHATLEASRATASNAGGSQPQVNG